MSTRCDRRLILASTSAYRAELLSRLRLPFERLAPGVEEAEHEGESPAQRALRLARDKALAVARCEPGAWVIGSDQVASCEGCILHKPGTRENTIEQLRRLSGRQAQFITAVALARDGQVDTALDVTAVRLRPLTLAEIERYVELEPAADCAGGFKVEGLGISLLEEVATCDPTALVGLPLIALRRLLSAVGFGLP